MRSLSKNNDIIITSSDKDEGTVIMDSAECNNKIIELLNDKTNYTTNYNLNIDVFN